VCVRICVSVADNVCFPYFKYTQDYCHIDIHMYISVHVYASKFAFSCVQNISLHTREKISTEEKNKRVRE